MADKSQEESEAPAKVYQVDALAEQLRNIEALIRTQNATYITKDALKLDLQVRDARIATLQDKLKTWTRFGWVVASAVATLLADNVWQLIVNSGRVH